jgi:hypothetical protein
MNLSPSEARKLGIDVKPAKRRRWQAPPIKANLFLVLCARHGLPEPVPELQFCKRRKWRLDWAWPNADPPTALEVDGGAWTAGRHLRGQGFINDQEKRNEATLEGWRVFHCVPADVEDGSVFELLRRALT